MVVIRMWGGLGNQLFIYGLYEKFRSLGKEAYVYIDWDYYSSQTNKNILYQLPEVGLFPEECGNREYVRSCLYNTSILWRIKKKICHRIFVEKEHGEFDSEVFGLDNCIIIGYFQSERYFADVGELLCERVCFKGADDGKIVNLVTDMKRKESVSVHVRLTDYSENKAIYGGICNEGYYKQAFKCVQQFVEKPVFYLFSDDLTRAMEMLDGFECVPVDLNNVSRSYLDMYLMKECKHNIIANSSFSWWAAWLNANNEKVIIAPKRWVNSSRTPDICPSNWIRIGLEG